MAFEYTYYNSHITKRLSFLLVYLSILPVAARPASSLVWSIDPDHVEGSIDERIYSQFLEHIYHSVEGGLWGELIWNRSFEEDAQKGFYLAENKVELNDQSPNRTLLMGDTKWKDYDFTLEARKTSGLEGGVFVLFRGENSRDIYRLDLGSAMNTRHELKKLSSPRQRQVLQSTTGSIVNDRWYRIHIRCMGPRLLCWLDDRLIFDYTDTQKPYLMGKIGIGVKDSHTIFRNIKVVNLEGQTLLDHLSSSLPRYWDSIGQGNVSLDVNHPLNSDVCLHLTGDYAGVQQTPINVVARETYTGSVWARGRARNGLVVRLIGEGTLLAEQNLLLQSEDWTEIPFTLQPFSSTAYASFQIGLAHGGTAWIDQVSLVSKSARETGGFNPNLLRLLAELRPPVLRWPGGYFVTHYHWKDGIGPQSKRRVYPSFAWDDRDTNAFGLDEFMRLCRQIQCQPIIVVNCHPPQDASDSTVDAYVQDTLDLMEYCNGSIQSRWGSQRAQNGHEAPYHVTYWELDDIVTSDQLELAQRWAKAMKTAYPDIKLLADAYYGTTPEIRQRNMHALHELGPDLDFISIEQYDPPEDYITAPLQWDLYLTQMQELIARSLNPKVKMYISEWNLTSANWRAGLYAGSMLNTFERHSNLVKMSSPAILMCHSSSPDDRTLIRFDQTQWYPSPTYVVMKLWRDFYAPTRLTITGNTDRLDAIATLSENQQWIYVKLVNPTPDAIDLTLRMPPHITLHKAQVWTIHAQLNQSNSFMQPNIIAPFFRPLPLSDTPLQVEVPAYSADVICLQRSL